jgi:hypothetical protein
MIERMQQPGGAPYAGQLHAANSKPVLATVSKDEGPTSMTIPSAIEEATAAPHKRSSKVGGRVAWTLAMSAIGVVVAAVIILGMKFIDGPVSGAGGVTLAQAEATSTPTPLASMLAGLYFELTYPGAFDQVSTLKNDTVSLEQYDISNKAQFQRLIAVSVRPLASGQLTDDSSFRFRQINPADYTQTALTLHGEPVVIIVKADHSEQTLFWAHKQKILTVSITSSNPKDSIPAYMKEIESTVRWRS